MSRAKTIKKKAKVIRSIIRVIGILVMASLIYTGVCIYSIVKTNINMSDQTDFVYNDHGTILPWEDDTIDLKVNVTVTNNGFFPIEFIDVYIEVYLIASDQPGYPGNPGLGDAFGSDLYIGDATELFTKIEPGESGNRTLTFELTPGPYELESLLFYDGTLRLDFFIQTQIQLFPINITGSITTGWSAIL